MAAGAGASLGAGLQPGRVVTQLDAAHIALMEGFHRRYMVSNKILRLWVRMVRELDIAMVVPQHGAPLKGEAIGQLLDWLENLSCGIDLMGAPQYQLPVRAL